METAVKRPKVTIDAVVIRADGTVENLGVICENAEVNKEEN